MKQLLFLLLFPCLALAQYTGNGNQKITLGEQTTADGLVFRGVASIDTVTATSKITRANKQDTSAFLLLDTTTNLLWHYKTASNGWIQAGGGVSVSSFSAGTTGLTPSTATTGAVTLGGTLAVANGGTGQSTLAAAGINTGSGTLNYLPKYTSTGTTFGNSLIFDNGSSVGIGTASPTAGNQLQLTGTNARLIMLNTSGNTSNYSQLSFGNGTANGQYAEMIRYNNTKQFSIFNGGGDIFFSTNYVSDYRYDLFIETDNGNVGIGTASPLSKLNVMGTVRINSAAAPDANYYLQLENSASQKAKANAWDTYSDKRIKTDIQPIFNAIDKVNLLNPVYYQKHDSYVENDFLNIDFDSSVKSLGFIAQEVYNIIPEAVNTGTTNELWAMDYTKIIPILTKAIQEQNALIKALEQRILILENK
jgi:hypothetical protein